MPSNPKKRGTNASQSFRSDEVEAGLQLLHALHRGATTAEVRTMLRQEPLRRLYSKFVRMKTSLAERQSGVG